MNGIVASFFVALNLATGAPGDSGWLPDYGEALQAARSAKQPLLVVLEKPDTKETRLDEVSLTKDETEKALLELYQLCRVDVSTPYGTKVAKAFGAEQFPVTIITDKQSKSIIFRKTGHFSGAEWVSTLVTYQNGEPTTSDPAACPNCRRR